ncbi:hypothetical protein [Burkholderia diffusa]|uniref:hypothetical protein n=1 Tax=Burkholderia diffusa TaxID=488732 RepID=UPI0012D8CEEA|nr:hypothetical protein [Burkholderia diffusa]
MTKQVLAEFVLNQPALPLALLSICYSIATYRSGHTRTEVGRILSREHAPFRSWFEVVASFVAAIILAASGSRYLLERLKQKRRLSLTCRFERSRLRISSISFGAASGTARVDQGVAEFKHESAKRWAGFA